MRTRSDDVAATPPIFSESSPLIPHSNVHNGYRWIALVLICFMSFGSYYCFDNPAALEDVMKADLKISSSTFTSFYSLYSWPNIILSFFGGALIDRFGMRTCSLLFSLLIFIGQMLFATGAYISKVPLMQFARFIFGIGCESLSVAQNTFSVSWFYGKELNFVFGVQISFARIGSTINMNSMRPIYESLGKYFTGHRLLGITLFVALGTCLISFLCTIALILLDKYVQRRNSVPLNPSKPFHISSLLHFPAQIWLLCFICATYYMSVFPFIATGLKFYESKYMFDARKAASANSVLFLLSSIFSPLIGYVVDKVGRNISAVQLAIAGTIFSYSLLTFSFVNPFFPVVILGLCYSLLAASLWPMVAMMISTDKLGTAFGLLLSVQNCGLAIMNIVSGHVIDSKGYFTFQLILLCLLLCSFACSFWLNEVSNERGLMLNFSNKRRRCLQSIQAENDSESDEEKSEST